MQALRRQPVWLSVLLSFLILVSAWQLLTMVGDYDRFILPGPADVWHQVLIVLGDGRLLRHTFITVSEVIPGLLPMPSFAWVSAAGRWREHLAALVDGGRITEERAAAWWRFQQEADAAGTMLGTLVTYSVFATR